MKLTALSAAVLSLFCFFVAATVSAQQPAAIAPAQPLQDGKWEEIDQRLLFLMVRLANVEASLDAVEAAISKSTGARTSSLSAAKRAEGGNELMDRKAGGPMKWSEFYGRTAEKFFYHPVDANTTYHTATLLRQNGPQADNKVGGGVPASQGLPVHQRPPQFDYIYRANETAKARAEQEAADLKNKIDELMARRAKLEAEQSALWCEVAFRAVDRLDLPRKPLYRFEPVAASVETDDLQRAEALKSASIFMRTALVIVSEAQKDQARAFGNIRTVVADAREKLDDSWLRQTVLALDVGDTNTSVGKFATLAKRLDDVSKNLSDSYEVSIDGDRFKDEQRKETFRALLQESLVNYAQIILALDEMTAVMASDWKMRPNVDRPLEVVPISLTTIVPPKPAMTGGVEPTTPVAVPSVARPVQEAGTLAQRLAGSQWVNTRNVAFEWDAQGAFHHGDANQDNRATYEYEILSDTRLIISFGGTKKSLLVFDPELTKFDQYSGTTATQKLFSAVRVKDGPADPIAPSSPGQGRTGGVVEPGNVALATNGTTIRGVDNPQALLDGVPNSTPPSKSGFGKPWIITLPKVYRLQRIKMQLWQERGRSYTYKIEASEDGVTFKSLIDRSQGQWQGWQVLDFPAQPIKVIRLTGLSDTKNIGFHVHEFEAYCMP